MIPKVTSQKGFSTLSEYVFKQGAHRITGNMMGRTPNSLYEEFEIIRKIRGEIRSPAWHVILSAPHGEHLSNERWKAISYFFLEQMELDISNHQYFTVRHTDTEHEHTHSVVNRIGFDGKIYHNRNDRWRAIEVCKLVEKEFGLKKTVRRNRDRNRGLERDFGRSI